jgi:hypothetical protein
LARAAVLKCATVGGKQARLDARILLGRQQHEDDPDWVVSQGVEHSKSHLWGGESLNPRRGERDAVIEKGGALDRPDVYYYPRTHDPARCAPVTNVTKSRSGFRRHNHPRQQIFLPQAGKELRHSPQFLLRGFGHVLVTAAQHPPLPIAESNIEMAEYARSVYGSEWMARATMTRNVSFLCSFEYKLCQLRRRHYKLSIFILQNTDEPIMVLPLTL